MPLNSEELKLLKKGNFKQRFELLHRISSTDALSIEHVPELILFLDDSWDDQKRGSAYGPTFLDPDKDFPIALEARTVIEKIGKSNPELVIPKLLELMQGHLYDPKHFYIMQLLGLLKVREAIPLFIHHILRGHIISVRVNFDQQDDFDISKAAAIAYFQTDATEFKSFIHSLLDGTYFIQNTNDAFYKNYALQYKSEWEKILANK